MDVSKTIAIENLDTFEEKPTKWRTLLALSLGYFVDQGEGQAMSIFSPVLNRSGV